MKNKNAAPHEAWITIPVMATVIASLFALNDLYAWHAVLAQKGGMMGNLHWYYRMSELDFICWLSLRLILFTSVLLSIYFLFKTYSWKHYWYSLANISLYFATYFVIDATVFIWVGKGV